MKVSELISKLETLRSQCGDVEVRVVSDDYFLSIHTIEDVREGQGYDYYGEIVVGK